LYRAGAFDKGPKNSNPAEAGLVWSQIFLLASKRFVKEVLVCTSKLIFKPDDLKTIISTDEPKL